MRHALESPLLPLVRDFRELQSRGFPCVLATVVSTEGSTYRKAGAQMLITDARELRGLLSGGCLEVDLVEHAREVLDTGRPRTVAYDMRGEHDLLFGIGSGCEGAMRVILQRVGPGEGWQPLEAMATRVEAGGGGAIAIVTDGSAAGRAWWAGGGDGPGPEPAAIRAARENSVEVVAVSDFTHPDATRALVIPLSPPPRLLVCGAGADARPLAQLAVALGFAVTIVDHRPALLDPARFPHCSLRCHALDGLAGATALASCDAALVMSHHLAADCAYLAALADRDAVRYVGLLGPAPRRDRLLTMLGPSAGRLRGRLRAPLGLDIGARTPEAIALAAAAELHAFVAERTGGSWHRQSGNLPT